MNKEEKLAKLEKRFERYRKMTLDDPTFWRLAFAPAVISMFKQGLEVTPETLIEYMKNKRGKTLKRKFCS